MANNINNQIAALNKQFNASVRNLTTYCNTQIKNIEANNLTVAVKNNKIQQIKTYFNKQYNNLNKTLNESIQALQQQVAAAQQAAAQQAAAQQAAAQQAAAQQAAAQQAAAQQAAAQQAAAQQQAAQQAAAQQAAALLIKNNLHKKALLVGCNYIGTVVELYGCINDVNNIQTTLKTKYNFSNIMLMTDNSAKNPTKANILAEFTSLLQNANSGDVLFFSFSGHGTVTKDKNGDEIDGLDEMFVGLDLNCISDDEIKAIIDKNLKQNVTLFALFDSCNSGTVLDLKYQYFDSTNYDNTTMNNNETETLGNVMMISGCMDSQTSADAYINNTNQGALSWAFNETVNNKPTIVWQDLLATMRNSLKTSQYTQIPQLSSGKALDVNTKICLL